MNANGSTCRTNTNLFKLGVVAITVQLAVGFVAGMAYADSSDNQKMTEARNLDQQIIHKILKTCEVKGL